MLIWVVWFSYGDRYYEGGVSSVYFWDLDDGFAGVVLLKKSMYVKGVFRSTSTNWGQPHQRAKVKVDGTRFMSSKPSIVLGRPTTNLRAR